MKAKIAVVLAALLFAVAPGLLIAQQINGGSGGGGSTSPGGSTTQVQFNDSSAFGGNSGFTFDKTLGNAQLKTTLFFNAGAASDGGTMPASGAGMNSFLVGSGSSGDATRTSLRGNEIWMYTSAGPVWRFLNSDLNLFADNTTSMGDATNRIKNIFSVGLTINGLATDATHTDNTVCVDSTSGVFYKGSGALGICLGTSSARYKHDIAPLGSSLAQIVALKPSTFFYNAGYGDDGARRQNGFIAEDVVNVAPELVALDADGKPNSVDMVAMVPMLVKAMQQQQFIIDCLRSGKSGC